MFRTLLLSATCLALTAATANAPARLPVLVELFTSEGCSSCPPADHYLAQLDSSAIVLSEHVDYWNQLGWKDKFSSAEMTHRQEGYVKTFGIEGPYTPEMVVDGAAEFTGSDSRRGAAEIDKASKRQKATIVLARTAAGVKIDIEAVPHEADIWVAVADNLDTTTRVGAGENKGRTLTHVAVVRSLRKFAYVKRGGTFSRQIDLPDANGERIVVFLQEAGQGHVWGAAMLPSGQM